MNDLSDEVLTIKTAIIGAGLAGVAAATHFLEEKYEDFMIFEALNRIGGRVQTIEFGKLIIKNIIKNLILINQT